MKIELLDSGYVEQIECWGQGKVRFIGLKDKDAFVVEDHTDYEAGIIEAARQSTQGSFRGWEKDAKLLKHLYSNNHSTPFEFAGMTIEVQAPIFVFREWHRHRTQSYNEMSARYSPLPDNKFKPTLERLLQVNNAGSNKQAGNVGGIELTSENAMKWLDLVEYAYAATQEAYRFGLAVGVEKGLARIPMPVGHYSRMRASASLRNWLAFLTLRLDPNAQEEIRQYAKAVGAIIAQNFPQTWTLFNDAHGL